MNTRISSRDWEKLSAYLDGELNRRERERLETRLKTNADLRNALTQLRQTRAVIRSLPTLRAPRNYTLSAKMIPERKTPARVYPALRLATALATLLFCLVVLGDFLIPRNPSAPAPQLAAQPNQTTVAMAPALEPSLQETPLGGGGQPESGANQPSQKSLTLSGTVTETEKNTEPARIMAAPPADENASTEQPSQATPEAGTTLENTPTASPTGEALAASEAPAVTPVVNQASGWKPIRIIEIILGLVALSTGLATYFVHRGAGL
jgi:hypothetical protein